MKHSDDITHDLVLRDTIIQIRVLHPDDHEREVEFLQDLTYSERYKHVLDRIGRSKPSSFGIIAEQTKNSVPNVTLGLARYLTDHEGQHEVTVLVAQEWENDRLDTELMKTLLDHMRHQGLDMIYCVGNINNSHLRTLARNIGMQAQRDPDDPTMMRYDLSLQNLKMKPAGHRV